MHSAIGDCIEKICNNLDVEIACTYQELNELLEDANMSLLTAHHREMLEYLFNIQKRYLLRFINDTFKSNVIVCKQCITRSFECM